MELINKKDAIHAVLHYTGDAAVAAVQEIKPILFTELQGTKVKMPEIRMQTLDEYKNPHGELREMLIDEIIDRMGEWEERYIADANPMFRRRFYCSRCGDWTTHGKTRYCPNCGAKMDGETEHGNTYSLGKIEMPKGAMKQIIADGERGERKDGE